ISRYGNKLGESENAQLVQAVVAPGSEFLGRSIRELDFSRQFDAVIVGLWRREGPVADRLSDARLREGDALVLWGQPQHFSDMAKSHGFLMLVPFSGEAKSRVRAPLALTILGLTVLAAVTEFLPASLAFLAGALAMVVTRCVDVGRAYRGIDVRIFVMIAGVIRLGDDGAAGADRDLAGGLAGPAADAVRGVHGAGRGGRVPDADRAPRQPADPGPGPVPLHRLPAHRPAPHHRHRPRQRLALPMALARRPPPSCLRLIFFRHRFHR